VRKFYGATDEGYFIDMGIPEDYHRAQKELQSLPLDLNAIDKTWTLFIDRDGVINHEKKKNISAPGVNLSFTMEWNGPSRIYQ
jgi:D-glycero-alpha-D-manno-heptose 1-phosphate guanylyltransferase